MVSGQSYSTPRNIEETPLSLVILSQANSRLNRALEILSSKEPKHRQKASRTNFEAIMLRHLYGGSTKLMDLEYAATIAESSFNVAEMVAKNEVDKATPSIEERKNLSEIIRQVHMYRPFHPVIIAQGYYEAGIAGYTPKTNKLDEIGKSRLEAAVSEYQIAYDRFKKYNEAFQSPQDTKMKTSGLRSLFKSWERAYILLGIDSYVRGNEQIKAKSKKSKEQGLIQLGEALEYFKSAMEIVYEADKNQIRFKRGNQKLINLLNKEIAEIRENGIKFANSLGRKDLVEKYFQT